MATNIGDINVGLTANVDQFKSALTQAQSTASSFTDKLKSQFNSLNGPINDVAKSFNVTNIAMSAFKAAIAALALNELKSIVIGVVNAEASLYKLSIQTGVSVSTLGGLKKIAADTDTPLETVAGSLSKLTRSMVDASDPSSKAAEAFKALGVSVRNSDGSMKDSLTVQRELAKSLENFADGPTKDAAVMNLMGKSAMELKLYLKDLASTEVLHGKTTASQAVAADELQRQMNILNRVSNSYKADLANAIIPTITVFINQLNNAAKAGLGLWSALSLAKDFGTDSENYAKHLNKVYEIQQKLAKLPKSYDRINMAKRKDLEDELAIEQKKVTYYRENIKFQQDLKKAKEEAEKIGKGTGGKPDVPDTGKKKMDLESAILGEKMKTWELEQRVADVQITNVARLEKEKELGKYKNASQAEYNRMLAEAQKQDTEQSAVDEAERRMKVNSTLSEKILLLRKELSIRQDETEVSKLQSDIEKDLYDGSGVLQAEALELAKALDLKRQTIKVDEILLSMRKQSDDIAGKIENQIKTRTLGAKALEKENTLLALNVEYQKKMADPSLTDASKSRVFEEHQKAIEKVNKAYDDLNAQEGDWLVGAQAAVNKYAENLRGVATHTEQAFTNIFKGLEDGLFNFFKTGKIGIKEFAQVIVDEIIRIQARLVATKIVRFIGGLFSGGSTPAASAPASAPTTVYAAKGQAFSGPIVPFAKGGVLSGPTVFPIQGGLGVANESGPEAVFPLTRNNQGKLSVNATGLGNTTYNNIVVNVESGKDANQTGDIVAEKVVRAIAKQEIQNATRIGGLLNSVSIRG